MNIIKHFKYVLAGLTITTSLVYAAGRIQNEDIKTAAELTAAGGLVSQLPNDSKIYVGGLGTQLSTAITSGAIANSTVAHLFNQIATPANPSAGFDKCYVKSDDKFYCLSSGGTESLVGPAAAGSSVITLPDSQILIGSITNVATANSVSGDLQLGNTGVTTVTAVGGQTSSAIANTVVTVAARTSLNTPNTLVFRDVNGDFSSNVITANLNGLATNITGIAAIANGGTGQTTTVTAFNALSPLTTKGDILTNDGTNDIREPVGANGFVLTADSSMTSGVKWATVTASGSGTASELFTLNGGISVLDDVDGMRRSESAQTLTKIVVCAFNSGLSGGITVLANYGPELLSSSTITLTANGGKACTSATPNASIAANDLMNITVTGVSNGLPEDLTVKFIF